MWHHTASNGPAQNDADYMVKSSDARPTANIVVDGSIAIVMAGGATNTNGSGVNSPMTFSRGTVEKDNMNKRAVGIEISNNGVGAAYSEKLMNFMFALSNKINAKCGNQPTDVSTHEFYAPDRKIDPAKASSVQGPWKPGSVNSSGTWNCGDLRNECKRRWSSGGDTPAPTPTTEEDVVWRVAKRENGAYFIGDGKTSYWVKDGEGDIDMNEALMRMAPGAINGLRVCWDAATDATAGPRMVTAWGQIKSHMQDKNIKKYIGATKRF